MKVSSAVLLVGAVGQRGGWAGDNMEGSEVR